ncbi:hypothetical protein vBAmePPT11V19_00086 [Alteromonas phage vB_AmeP_PT11-V19]|nr:hypothetical protein vBAmePPT11V19_00086 [Alteromonas phage vB_AmeP_PT11-V19]
MVEGLLVALAAHYPICVMAFVFFAVLILPMLAALIVTNWKHSKENNDA